MSSETHHHGTNSNTEKSKSGTCLLMDPTEENICNWLDSGFYLSASHDLQESRDKAALSPPPGMIQMTVQNYMRSLHHFSEMPVLSRWNSVGSSHSHPTAPKSVTEWLEFSEKDPVEILLDLGFGMDEPDICTKIPPRFINSASMAKGINIRVFIEAQRQRMDVEAPDLYGRFRQLQVLDHVTSAFSSLLNDINLMQQNAEDRNGEEMGVGSTPKGKTVVSQAKRRRIGQLLRKVSRQTTTHSSLAHRSTSTSSKTSEDYSSVVDLDKCIVARPGLCEKTAWGSLKEEMLPSEEKAVTPSHLPQPIASKTWGLPHLPIKQTHFLSTSEMLIKDRVRKEPNLLLNHMLKRVSGLNGKPSDSFEMEEIQSFEDDSSWGNPLESTSDVTRTNSCQSDSSGFLEDPSEPLPLQSLSLPGNLRISCNIHDSQAYLRHRKESALATHDVHPHVEASIGGRVPLRPSMSREQIFQGEEVFYSINEEDDLMETSSDRCEGAASGTEPEVHEKEMQDQGGQLVKEEDGCVEEPVSCHHPNSMDQDDTSSPEGDWLLKCSEMHENPGSAATEIGRTSPTKLSNGQICVNRKESEGLLTEEETTSVGRENEQEGIAESVEGKWRENKLDFPVPATDISVTKDRQDTRKLDIRFSSTGRPSEIALVSETEHGDLAAQPETKMTSSGPLQDPSLPASCLEKGGLRSLTVLSANTKLDKEESTPSVETKLSPSRSITIQMPSMLVSNRQSICLDEVAVKVRPLGFTFKASQHSEEEPTVPSGSSASKEEDKEVKEVSVQTERGHTKRATFPLFPFLPSFRGHSHLVKSASLDTGLYGEYRSCCYEPFNACCAQQGGHCCPLSSPHCCLLQPFPLAPLCKHPITCCSPHASLELQLLKTLKLLQNTAMRNISSYTVNEIEAIKNSCQKFRERLDEIEQHLIEQEILFSSAMSDEAREEKRRLQALRQAVRREVAELECQLTDRALQQLDQLLGEQSNLCSELGISNWREEKEARSEHRLPDAAATTHFFCSAGSKDTHHRRPSRSVTVPSSPSTSSLGKAEVLPASPLPPGKIDSTADSKELHSSKKEVKGPPQPKLDFKAFIQNLKKSFRTSFSSDATEGKD